MKMRWQRRRIALAHDGCRTRVEDANVLGDWAYLEVPADLRSLCIWGWQVTHVPTGRVLVGGLFDRATARRICRGVAGLTDWSQFPDGKPPRPVLALVFEVIRAAKDAYVERLDARRDRRLARRESEAAS